MTRRWSSLDPDSNNCPYAAICQNYPTCTDERVYAGFQAGRTAHQLGWNRNCEQPTRRIAIKSKKELHIELFNASRKRTKLTHPTPVLSLDRAMHGELPLLIPRSPWSWVFPTLVSQPSSRFPRLSPVSIVGWLKALLQFVTILGDFGSFRFVTS
jgi:hypothetical protein